MSVASSRVDTHEEMVVAENIVDQTSVSDVIEASQQPISDLENEYLGDFHDHTYGCNSKSINTEPVSPKTGFQIIVDEMSKMKEENDELREEVSELKQEISRPLKTRLTFDDISENDTMVKFYTGIPTSGLFLWLYEGVHDKLLRLNYYKGTESHERSNASKGYRPGPPRKLDHKSELLLTFMKLRLNLLEKDLGFRFEVSVQHVSAILSTYISFLGRELKKFIVWPSVEAVKGYNPTCFKKLGTVIAIIDCTEISAQTPSIAKSNSQMYSSYKGRTTVKVLVGCSPSGSVSYVSKASGGSMSDREIVVRSDFLNYVNQTHMESDETTIILADKGFNIQDVLLPYNVKLVIPPFLRGKSQSNEYENRLTKQVASSRIHVERVINRLKHFRILQNTVSSEFYDLIDYMIVICGAIVNLNKPLVPLK